MSESRPKMRTPTNVPASPPRPPMRLVPPITTAAMASSSRPEPASGFPCRYWATNKTPASPARKARDHVGGQLDLRDLDARKLRRLRIAADRVDVAAEGREAQNSAEYEDCGEEEDARHRQDAPDHRAQDFEGLGGVRAGVNGDDRVVLARRQAAEAERAHHHRERRDEGLEPAGDDQRAVDRSERQRDARRHKQHGQHAELRRNLRRSGDSDERRRRRGRAAPECGRRAKAQARSRFAGRRPRRVRARARGRQTEPGTPTPSPAAIAAAGTAMIEAGVHPG